MTTDFLGVGWAFPVRIGDSGMLELSRYEDNVRESIGIILGTAKGERQMRPDFGCGVHELVFARNNMTTAGLAVYHVEKALIRWEPRIELIGVAALPDPESEGRLDITVEYRVIATNSIFNLVYPFYLTEGVGV